MEQAIQNSLKEISVSDIDKNFLVYKDDSRRKVEFGLEKEYERFAKINEKNKKIEIKVNTLPNGFLEY